jgi:hypothetical protein
MTGTENRGPEWYLLAISLVADTAGILSFIGFQANRDLRLIVAGTLAAVGTLAAAITLIKLLILWLSPAGSYIPGAHYSKTLLRGSAALLVSLVIGFAFVALAKDDPDTPSPTPSPSTPSASHR